MKPYEWSPVIHAYVYLLTKVPCEISYKNAKVYLDGNIFLKIRGKCISCLSNFFGQDNEQPVFESNVIIECTYSGNYMNCKCQKKGES